MPPEDRVAQALRPVRFKLPDPCPPVMTVPEAGRLFFGLGETRSYEARDAGLIPAVQFGSRWFVPVGQLLSKLGVPTAPVQLEQES